jgi:hypothetical protein
MAAGRVKIYFGNPGRGIMENNEREALRIKHCSADTQQGRHYCRRCLDPYPCDVIKVLDELDQVANAAEIYGITVKHLTERNIESKVLAVIHAYDETAESKLARIWQILGEKA